MYRAGLLASLLILSVLTSCGGPGRASRGRMVENRNISSSKIEVQAFLYDAKFLLQGRRRSVRLEVFKDGDRIALAGRGYLGKTALKGWMTVDTLLVYFPGSNEYIYEANVKLLASSACLDSIFSIDIPALFTMLASDVLPSSGFLVAVDSGHSNTKSSYLVTSPGCDWEFALTYKTDKRGCRLKSLKYDSTKDNNPELEAKLRTFKERATVKASRFEVYIPDEARRIIP